MVKGHTANRNKAWNQVFLAPNPASYPLYHAYGGFLGVRDGHPTAGTVTGDGGGGWSTAQTLWNLGPGGTVGRTLQQLLPISTELSCNATLPLLSWRCGV